MALILQFPSLFYPPLLSLVWYVHMLGEPTGQQTVEETVS